MEIVRELSYEERRKYGKCAVCGAEHGHGCNPDVGFAFGGQRPENGVHLARIQNAPLKVREVPVG